MRRRVTVTIERELEKKIRTKQAQLIQECGKNISFSRTLEIMVQKYLEVNEVNLPYNYIGFGMEKITADWR